VRLVRETVALALVAFAAGTQLPLTGWNAGAHYALVQSLADGTPRIDRHLNQSGDIAYYHGHYYAAKSPGLAMLSLPVYELFKAAGAVPAPRPTTLGPPGARGIEEKNLWQVNLAVVACFLALLLLVRSAVERFVPGAGGPVALVLGLGTMLLPFATVFFSHVPSATFGFASFAVLLAARASAPGWRLAAAGLLAGLAVCMEVTLATIAACLLAYAAWDGPRMRRALLFGGGFVVGLLPFGAYDWWAFGSPFQNGYSYAVKEMGVSGHDVLGANSAGFFGLTRPTLDALREILVSERGLFVLTPVTVVALAGLLPLARRGHRREAVFVGATSLAMFVFNASYYLPLGGGTPGPRFLVPLLPLLALPLAAAFRAWPLVTLLTAAASIFWMVVATVGEPILDPAAHPTLWVSNVVHATNLAQSIFGVGHTAEAAFAAPAALALVLVLRLPRSRAALAQVVLGPRGV
jgi:hypothetical protein